MNGTAARKRITGLAAECCKLSQRLLGPQGEFAGTLANTWLLSAASGGSLDRRYLNYGRVKGEQGGRRSCGETT